MMMMLRVTALNERPDENTHWKAKKTTKKTQPEKTTKTNKKHKGFFLLFLKLYQHKIHPASISCSKIHQKKEQKTA
jgi:hypothetical protein